MKMFRESNLTLGMVFLGMKTIIISMSTKLIT